jgi:hypothetical protein
LKREDEELNERKENETKGKENKKMDERSNNITFLLCFHTYTLLNIDFFLMATVAKG